MSFTAVIPPKTGAAEAAVAALLDVAGTQAFTGAAGRVVYGVEPALPALSKAAPGRLVVRRRGGPFSNKSEHLDRVTSIELTIRADVKTNMGGDAGAFLSGLHLAVFNALEGASPSVAGAAVLHPLRRIEPESMVLTDNTNGFHFSRTVFKLVLQPE